MAQISLLQGTSGIRAASDTLNIFRSNADTPSRKPFEIDDADARSVQKTPAGTVKNVRPVHFLPTCLLRKHAAA